MGTESELLELAKEKFEKLTEVDKKLFAAAAKGEVAYYSSKKSKKIISLIHRPLQQFRKFFPPIFA